MSGFETWNKVRADEIIGAHAGREGSALPILHALQEVFGYVDGEAVPLMAEALNVSRAEIHGLISFYHDFRATPPGRHTVKLCRGEACQSMGADALALQARERLGVDWGETTADGRVTLEPVFCLGLCACAPSAMADGKLVGRLDAERLGSILDKARQS